MAFDFLTDLDDYFCEKYADYDKICVLKGYSMPKMHATERRADGRDYSYTLPMSTMRLAKQKEKASLLRQVKDGLFDPSFSFSFRPLGLFERFRGAFKKVNSKKVLAQIFARNSLTADEVKAELDIDEYTWKKICKGQYHPTKNLVFSIAITAHLPIEDMYELMEVCELGMDFTKPKDVVVAYLVEKKVFNQEMVRAAADEYKLANLFIKWLQPTESETEEETKETKEAKSADEAAGK